MSTQLDTESFFARRVTERLVAEILPAGAAAFGDRPSVPYEVGFRRIWSGIADVGQGAVEVLSGVLARARGGVKAPLTGRVRSLHSFGSFLVVVHGGTVRVYRGGKVPEPVKGAQVFIVADCVGVPLARLVGESRQSPVGVGPSHGQHQPGTYTIQLWLDPVFVDGKEGVSEVTPQSAQRIGTFIERFMKGRDDLSFSELVAESQSQMAPLFEAMLDAPAPSGVWAEGQSLPASLSPLAQAAVERFHWQTEKLLGLSAAVTFRPGRRRYPHRLTLAPGIRQVAQQYAVSPEVHSDQWQCGGCQLWIPLGENFCRECGKPKPSAVQVEASQSSRRLTSADGHELVIDLAFQSYDQPDVPEDAITTRAVSVLEPFCGQRSLKELREDQGSTAVSSLLSATLSDGTLGPIGEFSVLFLRDSESEWFQQNRARVQAQLREVQGDAADLEVSDALLALREKRLLRDDRELELLQKEFMTGLARTAAELTRETAEQQLHAEAEKSQRSVARESERHAQALEREDEVEESRHRRAVDEAALVHDLVKDKQVLSHELDKDAMLDATLRAKSEKDLDFEERMERLRHRRSVDQVHDHQSVALEGRKADQELELERVRLAADLERQKLEAMSAMDLKQQELKKNMSVSQIMAMQAAALAQAGATGALANLASEGAAASGASTEAAVAKTKADMLQAMLEMQQKSGAEMKEAVMGLVGQMLGAQQQAHSEVLRAKQDTVDSAVKWNDRSIDAMAKVAGIAAGRGGKADARGPATQGSERASFEGRPCGNCGKALGAQAKFCHDCGTAVA